MMHFDETGSIISRVVLVDYGDVKIYKILGDLIYVTWLDNKVLNGGHMHHQTCFSDRDIDNIASRLQIRSWERLLGNLDAWE